MTFQNIFNLENLNQNISLAWRPQFPSNGTSQWEFPSQWNSLNFLQMRSEPEMLIDPNLNRTSDTLFGMRRSIPARQAELLDSSQRTIDLINLNEQMRIGNPGTLPYVYMNRQERMPFADQLTQYPGTPFAPLIDYPALIPTKEQQTLRFMTESDQPMVSVYQPNARPPRPITRPSERTAGGGGGSSYSMPHRVESGGAGGYIPSTGISASVQVESSTPIASLEDIRSLTLPGRTNKRGGSAPSSFGRGGSASQSLTQPATQPTTRLTAPSQTDIPPAVPDWSRNIFNRPAPVANQYRTAGGEYDRPAAVADQPRSKGGRFGRKT